MRVKDFEVAVDALNCSIKLDEVRINKGHVRYLFGHKGALLILWDESGRAFSRNIEGDEISESPSYLLDGVLPVDCYVRDAEYDLKLSEP